MIKRKLRRMAFGGDPQQPPPKKKPGIDSGFAGAMAGLDASKIGYQQPPQKKPIRLYDPNDPRLSRYNDSMAVYRYGEAAVKDVKSMKELASEKDFVNRDNERYQVASGAFDRLKAFNGHYPDNVGEVSRTFGYERNDRVVPYDQKTARPDNDYVPMVVSAERFARPVQPYYYKPEQKTNQLPPTSPGGIVPVGSRGKITASSNPSSSVEARSQPTPFSFSGMDRDTHQQRTVYFPDLKSWQEFSDSQGYMHRTISKDSAEAHATGYFKYGGDMRQRKFKKLFAGGNPDDPGNPTGMSLFTPWSDKTNGAAWSYNPVTTPNTGTPTTSWLTGPPPSADKPQGDGMLPPVVVTPSARRGVNWSKVYGDVSNAATQIMPYASNIANALRRPPMPFAPTLINPVTLSRIDLSDARNRISRSVRAQDINADRSLNPQAAAAVRNANLAKEIEGTSQVSEQEAFLNSRQRAEQAGMNLNVESMNAQAQDRYRDNITQRNIAYQREQSANLANASDKAIAQQNERRKEALDLKKIGVLSQMWKQSGVYDRMLKKLKAEGIDDPTGITDQMDGSKAYGGKIATSGGGVTFAFGGPGSGPGTINATNIAAAKNSGMDEATKIDHINSILSGASHAVISPYGDTHNQLAMQAYMWRQQNPGRSPQELIQGFYGKPVVGGNPVDSLRQQMNVYSPASMYNSTPDIGVRKAFGGFTAATKTFPRTTGRATGQGMISPFGNARSVNLGSGIPHGKFNPKGITHTHVYDKGGVVDKFQIDGTPDMLMTNGHSTMTPGVYKMGGTFMNYPSRPKAIRRMDFAGIEHMAMGGVPGIFDSDPYNVKAKGGWISKAVNPAHKGFCTPMTKSTCTPRRKAFAMTMKKHHGFH